MMNAWAKVALGEICVVLRGTTITQVQTTPGSIPVIAGGVGPSYFCATANRNSGVVSISASGANAGYVNYWDQPIFASDCSTIESKNSRITDTRFIYHQLKYLQPRFQASLRKGAAQPHVYAKDLANLIVAHPPLDEQRRIVAILDKADEVRAKRKAALETLETLGQAIFIEMFGDPSTNPMGWPQVEISSLVNSVKTWTPQSDLGGEFTYIDVSSVDRNSTTVTGAASLECSSAPSRAKQLVSDGDVLVSTVRPNLNGVALITTELDGATASTGFTVLRPKQGVLTSQYLFEWVKSPFFIERLVRKATGASYPAVSDRIIKSETLSLPSIDAQLEFTSRMTQASKWALTAQLQANAAENLFSAIQQRAFRAAL